MSETTTSTDAEIDAWVNDIHCGDVHETLAELPESSVHTVMTSPPYFGLRDYGVDGQIGLEDSLDEYIAELVAVGDELRRVLRDDGSWWLNLGDTFSNDSIVRSKGSDAFMRPGDDGYEADHLADERAATGGNRRSRTGEIPHKCKMLVPHRVAIALIDAGWIVRNDCVWDKAGSEMPESVTDRLSKTFEYVFHLVPDQDYWYDLDAIREPHAEESLARATREDNRHDHSRRQSVATEETLNPEQFCHPSGKNPGDIFRVTTKSFPDAHFAVYPPELVETPLKATCPPEVCADCGTPYAREITETTRELPDSGTFYDPHAACYRSVDSVRRNRDGKAAGRCENPIARPPKDREFDGWRQQCDCATDETTSGIALDPFAGAGTTCLVAKRLGRRFIGIDLNEEYVAMAQQRVGVTVDQPELLLDADETSLTQFADTGGDADD